MTGRIHQINISRGGVPKRPVLEAEVGSDGIAGDGHNHPDIHGGPERALCLYSLDLIEQLAQEGHPIAPGSVGENVTLSGIDWGQMQPGTRLRLGSDVVVELTRDTTPCKTIAAAFKNREFVRIGEKLHPGWSRMYARVIQEGTIRPGDTVEIDS